MIALRHSASRRLIAARPRLLFCISTQTQTAPPRDIDTPPVVIPDPTRRPITQQPTPPPEPSSSTAATAGSSVSAATSASAASAAPEPAQKKATERPKPRLRATKTALTLTPTAVDRLRSLIEGPTPKLIRIGVRNKGCAGMSYHLEYVDKPGKFDEVVEQDGVKVLIDSKALFSIIGSEMDWKEDRLSSKFAFTNPNIKDACGCGESFTV